MGKRTSRRDLLKSGALATAGAGGLLAAAPEAVAAKFNVDVVIVGGGYGGISAAWELHKAGKSVVLVEANSRVGGRVWSAKLSNGFLFEIGGQWVGDFESEPDIREYMAELGVGNAVYKQFTEGNTIFVGEDGSVGQYNQNDPDPFNALPPVNPVAKFELVRALLNINAMSTVVNPDAPWEDHAFPDIPPPFGPLVGPQTTVEADQVTLETWIQANVSSDPLADPAKALIRAVATGSNGTDPGGLSLLHMLFFVRTFNSNILNLSGSGPGQANGFRVASPGAQRMANLIAAKLPKYALQLNSPVTDIVQDGQGVTVFFGNTSARGKQVIIASPTCLDNFMRYTPPLPPDRAQLQQRAPQGSVWKIWLVYDQAFWRGQGLVGESVSIFPPDFVRNARDGGGPAGVNAPGLQICFVAGDEAREFNAMTRAQRKAQVLSEMVHRYGPVGGILSPTLRFPASPPQNPVPDNYWEFNWSIAEWARGDFAFGPGPGVWTGVGFGPALREPVGRIHWAGVDTATYPFASMSGAIQSGKRAAQEVLPLL